MNTEYNLCRGHLEPEQVCPFWCHHCNIESRNTECFFYEPVKVMVRDFNEVLSLELLRQSTGRTGEEDGS